MFNSAGFAVDDLQRIRAGISVKSREATLEAAAAIRNQ